MIERKSASVDEWEVDRQAFSPVRPPGRMEGSDVSAAIQIAPRCARIAAAVAYSILLIGIMLWPEPVDAGVHDETARWIWRLNSMGIDSVGYADIESISNVLLFIPFGLVVAMLVRRRMEWTAVVAGISASFLAESAQWLLLPERFATIEDVLANGTGAALGAFVVAAARSLSTGTPRAEPADGNVD